MAIVFLFSNHKSKKNKKKKEALHDTVDVDKKFEENFADLEQLENNKKQKKKKNK
ncbi:MAG: hypothetical protein K9L24_04065 [Spirochaetia bacterium]|nr:hypothetical protein [Spirochaetia bacterium]MCF7946359.1 hypothetical protein [Spirochaetia bacterium]